MRITLRQLELFIEVAKVGHLTQVAKRFGLSQSAVSMALKELENILGCRLFERVQKRLVLNEKGRAFFKEVEPLVTRLRDIETEFMSQENRGQLVIGASTTIADYILPHVVCEYMERYPEVKLQLRIGNTAEITQLVESGGVDVGYIEGEIASALCQVSAVGHDELVVVTADEELGRRGEYYIDTLLDKKWILREEGSGTKSEFVKKLGKFASELNIFLELRHTEAIKNVLKEVPGSLSCVSRIAVRKELEEGSLHRIRIKGFDFGRHFYSIHHKNKYQSELFKKFTLFARSKFAQLLGGAYA